MKTKAHLVFPQEILEEVDQIAGKTKRNVFIVKATQEKLERERDSYRKRLRRIINE